MPIQYGGLNVDYCECNPEFTVDHPATEIIVKPVTKQTVEIIVNEVKSCFSSCVILYGRCQIYPSIWDAIVEQFINSFIT